MKKIVCKIVGKIHYIFIPAIIFFNASLGGSITNEGMDWYKTINLPSFTPPGFVIGIVWTFIFVLMSIALILFWNKSEKDKVFYITIFTSLINLLLNSFWSFAFFYKHDMLCAAKEALVLEASVLFLIFLMWKKSKLSSLLLIPYAIWTLFASYLTYQVYLLN